MDIENATDKQLMKRFVELLEREEESDEGRLFKPTQIVSCRAMDGHELNQIVHQFKLRGNNE